MTAVNSSTVYLLEPAGSVLMWHDACQTHRVPDRHAPGLPTFKPSQLLLCQHYRPCSQHCSCPCCFHHIPHTHALADVLRHQNPPHTYTYTYTLHALTAMCCFPCSLTRMPPCRQYTSYQALEAGAVGRRLSTYLSALQQHPAVVATLYHPAGLDYHTELLGSYARYADGSANSMMARDAKKS